MVPLTSLEASDSATNNMSLPRWHLWSTEAGGLAVDCFHFIHPPDEEGRRLMDFFIYVQNYAWGWLELNFKVHALHLKGLSSRSSYVIGVAS